MAILSIARMGHPVLRRCAEEVLDPSAPEIRELVADMIETMEDADGAGLAAPQVLISKRVVIFHVPKDASAGPGEADVPEGEEVDDDGESGEILVLINPVVEPMGEDIDFGWEGCLSVPDMRGVVPRHRTIRYRGVTPEGEDIDRTVSGFQARVVQHEVDHLDGILYPMRMPDLSLLGYVEELDRYGLGEETQPEADAEEEAVL
ncbi:MAG: peptide deformylase [Alphaproteobacteria bacterium]